jgi:hypothetical protein
MSCLVVALKDYENYLTIEMDPITKHLVAN